MDRADRPSADHDSADHPSADRRHNTHGAKPAHIAFMAVPAHGHVNPGLALITELVARGHRVTYAIPDDFAPQVKDAGATPLPYTSQLPSAATQEEWPEDQAAAMSLFLDETIAVLPQVEALYADDRPDLIVYDIAATQAPILGEKWGIPYVQLSPTHVAFEGFEEEFGWEQTPAMDAFFARFNEFLRGLGVGLTFERLMMPPRCVVTIPRSFQYRGDTVAGTYTFVGPMLTDRAFQGDWQAPDDRPVLLISMGSAYTDQPDFYRTCMAAFGDLDWHVVLSIGKVVDPAELGDVPSNFEVHQWVPQLRILSQASAFLTHAGMGGTMEGLYHGVPLIAVPKAADQFPNAARIEELGLGKHIPADQVTVDGLRDTLLSVVADEGMRTRLAEMRREIRESGGVRGAADVVEAQLR